ncbi:hypothetical protein HPB50_007884 [Hyalomma asiaticum]|uniref:Uncharacterized protein n=1 Tax=Hyalomma asiaticum TaxID=266040 RepID=A0ACB7TET4_HYAAI|nr:hypothetical protein HPB50_007884 [Hyalomma asiaticum]
MPPLKQRRLDAAAEPSHQTSVEEADTRQLDDADYESPKHGEHSSTSVRSELLLVGLVIGVGSATESLPAAATQVDGKDDVNTGHVAVETATRSLKPSNPLVASPAVVQVHPEASGSALLDTGPSYHPGNILPLSTGKPTHESLMLIPSPLYAPFPVPLHMPLSYHPIPPFHLTVPYVIHRHPSLGTGHVGYPYEIYHTPTPFIPVLSYLPPLPPPPPGYPPLPPLPGTPPAPPQVPQPPSLPKPQLPPTRRPHIPPRVPSPPRQPPKSPLPKPSPPVRPAPPKQPISPPRKQPRPPTVRPPPQPLPAPKPVPRPPSVPRPLPKPERKPELPETGPVPLPEDDDETEIADPQSDPPVLSEENNPRREEFPSYYEPDALASQAAAGKVTDATSSTTDNTTSVHGAGDSKAQPEYSVDDSSVVEV